MTPAVLWRELMSFHHKIKGFMKTSQIIVFICSSFQQLEYVQMYKVQSATDGRL